MRLKRGFTLMEVLVVLLLIGMMGAIAAGIYRKVQEQKAFDVTTEIMEKVKKAILGSYTPHMRGVGISGYVADMGNLPPLNNKGQPEALWKKGEVFSALIYNQDARIWLGWNGPYIREPESGFLTDGWGNALSFTIVGDSLVIKSYGADKKEGGLGINMDKRIMINKGHYMAPVGGHIAVPGVGSVTINYPEDGTLESAEMQVDNNGNFMSDAGHLVPIGLRSIELPAGGKPIVFSVQPGMNWLGRVE